MDEVKAVVDYAINNGNVCLMLNSHLDKWYDRMVPGQFVEVEVDSKLNSLWTQIATTFKDYDEHLLFAGTRSSLLRMALKIGVHRMQPIWLFRISSTRYFVDAVRATGGNNSWRVLVVQSYAADPQNGINGFVKPTDTVNDRSDAGGTLLSAMELL